MTSLDSFKCQKTLKVGGKTYVYYSLPTAEKNGLKGISRLPYSMKVLLENLLRNEDDRTVKKDDILAVAKWLKKRALEHEIAFRPARVLMQDFTGVPAVVDLAAMRNATSCSSLRFFSHFATATMSALLTVRSSSLRSRFSSSTFIE